MIGSALIARIVPYAIVIQTKTKCFFATSVTGISYFKNVKTMISILYYYDSILLVLSTIFLCCRGYHSYCVGLDEIPNGRWHCKECSICSLCGINDPLGGLGATEELNMSMRGKKVDWVFEYKPGSSGGKIYSHTMCIPCHR